MSVQRVLPIFIGILVLTACRNKAPNESLESNNPAIETPAPEGAQSVLDLVETTASLSTLTNLIQRSGLDSTLSSEGPFTLFAPTNAAFSDLNVSFNSIPTVELRRLLAYHMIPTRMRTPDIPGDMTIQTLSGNDVSLHPGSDGLSITDANGHRARVVTPDLDVPNGVIHVIDQVLISGE